MVLFINLRYFASRLITSDLRAITFGVGCLLAGDNSLNILYHNQVNHSLSELPRTKKMFLLLRFNRLTAGIKTSP